MHELIAPQGDQPLVGNGDFLLTKADPRHRAWVEVNPSAIEANASNIRRLLAKDCSLMAVVKADGYGHGAKTVAEAALKGGASSLGVATLQEAIELREAGVVSPILILGNLIHEEDLFACLHLSLIPTISSFREVSICQKLGARKGCSFGVQLKIDTGMTRLGCDFSHALAIIKNIQSQKNLHLIGVYSHLAKADEDLNSSSDLVTFEQKKKFDSIINSIGTSKEKIIFHLANSAATLRNASFHYDMVRVGLALYGYSPIRVFNDDLCLALALSVKARVTLIRYVPEGIGVSYGHAFITKRSSRLAVIGIGYADGVNRALSGKISVLFQGKSMPQIGTITMDQLVVDVTDHPDVIEGSVVTLLGYEGSNLISVQDWSDLSGSIPWEVLCGFKNRLPRVII